MSSAWLAAPPAAVVAVFQRRPEHDSDSRPDSDLDLLVFDDDADDLLVERRPAPAAGGPSLDLLRLPATLLAQPQRLAAMGLITHRLLTADCVFDSDGRGRQALDEVGQRCWTSAAQQARLASFLDMGWLTVREVGVSLDWPALALFWLHMAHAAAIATALDALGLCCPNVYTRPLPWARQLQARLGTDIAAGLRRHLLLDADPAALASVLRTLHARVRQRCPEPLWPAAMGSSTRHEYRYWLQPAELQERLAAARAMAAAGDPASAVFYLRYAAYSVARLAMLHQRALEGWPRHIPFIRPETRVLPDLRAHHPDLVPLLDSLLGPATAADVQAALTSAQALRDQALQLLAGRGLGTPDGRRWEPYRARPALPS